MDRKIKSRNKMKSTWSSNISISSDQFLTSKYFWSSQLEHKNSSDASFVKSPYWETNFSFQNKIRSDSQLKKRIAINNSCGKLKSELKPI